MDPSQDPAARSVSEAIDGHDSERLAALLAQGADPEARLDHPNPIPVHAALHEVIDGAPRKLLSVLLAAGADVNRPDDHGFTLLSVAASEDDTALVAYLLSEGADANERTGEGELPLHIAAEAGSLEMCRILLDYGATESMDEWSAQSGLTALGLAAQRLDRNLLRLLVAKGAMIGAKDDDYKVARQRLPDRTPENAEDWDTASRLLE